MADQKVMGYSREDLMKMDEVALRALIRERTHHTIEVLIYDVLAGRRKPPEGFGQVVRFLHEIWKSRGLSMEPPDLQWSQRYVELAERVVAGESVDLRTSKPSPFSKDELSVVEKLLYDRRSIRAWERGKIPEWMIREILRAGIAAPCACNLEGIRFIVTDDPTVFDLIRSDIPTENATMIILCQDLRAYRVTRHQEIAPQNLYFDAAIAADHMLLMAHALGLGGVWLTHGEETTGKIRAHYGLSDDFLVPLHIAFGFPAEAPIKSQRMNLEEFVIAGL